MYPAGTKTNKNFSGGNYVTKQKFFFKSGGVYHRIDYDARNYVGHTS